MSGSRHCQDLRRPKNASRKRDSKTALKSGLCSFVKNNNSNKYYIRVGTQSREATPEELARLFQQRGAIRAELRPVSGATLADLDRRRLSNYFTRIRRQTAPADADDAAWRSLLVNTEIMTEEGVTVGGMLLFGNTPSRFLPQSGIDSARSEEHTSEL